MSLKDLIEQGFSVTKAALILGININDAKKEVNAFGYTLLKEEFNNNKIELICDLYNKGVSAKQLGLRFGISKVRVQKWVQGKGISVRSQADSHRITEFNQNIFDIIDTEEKAYWLGFFYADAYNSDMNNTFKVILQKRDVAHLRKLAAFIGLPVEKAETKGNVCKLNIYSKHICEKLTEHGCPRAKSFIITYPDWLPSDLNRHFIRGLFDGDGSLTGSYDWKVSIATTSECANSLHKIIFEKLNINSSIYSISKTNNNTYCIDWSGNNQVEKIMDYLYDGASIYLERKMEKYNEFKNLRSLPKRKRDSYSVSSDVKEYIKGSDNSNRDLSRRFNLHPRTVAKIKTSNLYKDCIVINGVTLTSKYIRTLSMSDREALVEPIFDYLRNIGFTYPILEDFELNNEFIRLQDFEPNIEATSLNNNTSIATSICKYFCKSFYSSSDDSGISMIDVWNSQQLKEVIRNRLVLNWVSSTNEVFDISPRMMIQGMRSMRAVPSISIFKPEIAKFMCMRYSEPGDVVGDYSCGFGARLLGAMSCGRKYVGTDPLTVPELKQMVDFFNFNDCNLIQSGSESYRGEENSIDLYWSSPPYFNQEVYSNDSTQAYNQGEEYFYETYWRNTLKNVKFMLKPGKWFGLNVKNYPKMVDMAIEEFGEIVEKIELTTHRSHLTKNAGNKKAEWIYMFRNNK